MEPQIIRTYSRLQPYAVFKTAAKTVPKYPDLTNAPRNVRVSRLHEKTLKIGSFDDTFDRLATGIINLKKENNSDDGHNNDDDDNISEAEPLETGSQDKDSNVQEARLNKNDDKPELIKKKESAMKQKTGLRKKNHIENNVVNFEESALSKNDHKKEVALRKRKKISSNDINEKKKPDTKGLQKKKLLNKNLFNVIDNIPTSTPRESKMRKVVDIYNLSPITFDKENNENEEQNSKLLITPHDNTLQKHVAEFEKSQDNNINNVIDNIKHETVEINSQEFNSHIGNEIPVAVTVNENTVENNLNNSKLLPTNKLLNVNNDKTFEDNNKSLENHNDEQINMDKQYANLATNTNDQENGVVVNYMDSCQFNTENDENDFCEEKTIVLNNIINNLKDCTSTIASGPAQISKKLSVAQDFDKKSIIVDEKNIDSLQNASEFSLHEWTNDYNSSYEYYTESERKKKLENIYNNETVKNEPVALEEENVSEPINGINSENYENVVMDMIPNESQVMNNTTNRLIEGPNSDDQTLNVTSHNGIDANVKTTSKNYNTRLRKQKKEHLGDINGFSVGKILESDVKNKLDNVNNDNLNVENHQASLDENVLSKYRSKHMGGSKFKQSLEGTNASEEKAIINDYKKIKIIGIKNMDVKLNYKKAVVHIKRLDDNVCYKTAAVPSRRSSKKASNVSAIKRAKNVKKRAIKAKEKNVKRSEADNAKINDVVEVKNKIAKVVSVKSSKKSSRRLSGIKKAKESSQASKNKKLVVLLTRLEDIDEKYKSLVMPKSNGSQEDSFVFAKPQKILKPRNTGRILLGSRIHGVKSPRDSMKIGKCLSLKNNVSNYNEMMFAEEESLITSRLSDLTRITTRTNMFKARNVPLTAIAENYLSESVSLLPQENEIKLKTAAHLQRKMNYNDFKENSLLEERELTKHVADDRRRISVVLKPGKSWARSLSIINHFQNVQNLDEFAIGRGKDWRHSVQSILNMQPEDVKQHDKSRITSIIGSPRISRRFSIRIIPSSTRFTLIDDLTDIQNIVDISGRRRQASIARSLSRRIRKDSLIETEADLIRSAKDIILKRCKQTSYLSFADCFPDTYIDYCRKIGEGVYGEVFLYENKNEKSVIKIIPIEGDELVNCEPQKKFHEILSEIIISQELHKLRFGEDYNTNGFIGINKIMCINGAYPNGLIDLWKKYDLEKKSENDCPSMFNEQQLFIALELTHGGQDLEAYIFQNASESYSIFIQIAFSLAVAEKSLEFEHRDLHWGNLLISKTNEANSIYKFDGTEILIPTKGVKVSLIDFTLSRMSYQGCKIFNDLSADPTLFTAEGEYQFDIYRMMKENVNNDWQQFKPYTNILWLDYILDKIVTVVKYKKKTTKIHKSNIAKMKLLRNEILDYKSAYDFVKNCKQIVSISNVNSISQSN